MFRVRERGRDIKPQRENDFGPAGTPRQVRYARLLVFCAALLFLGIASQSVLRIAGSTLDLTANSGPGQIFLYILVLACIALFAHRERHSLLRRRSGHGFLSAFVPTLTAVLLCYALLFRGGALTFRTETANIFTMALLGKVALAAVIVPVLVLTEEVIFRAFLFDYLRGRRTTRPGDIAAALVSSLIFAGVHKFREPGAWLDERNTILFVNLFLLGMLLCVVYRFGRQLIYPVGVHTGILLPEVVRNQSHLWELHQRSAGINWLGTNGDLRTSPLTSVMLVLLLAFFWQRRGRFG